MSTELAKIVDEKIIESLVLQGDISKMNQQQKVEYYNWLCSSLGLNPATQPFQIIKFQGKEILYAKKDATEQLRKIYSVSVTELEKLFQDGLYIVTAKVQDKSGRCDAATGAVTTTNLKGEMLANAIMKAETKAKRRATLSICGLGMLDESETDSIGNFQTIDVKTGEIIGKINDAQTEIPKSTRNFFDESKDITTKEQYVKWLNTITTEEDQKASYNAKQAVLFRLTELNIDKTISNIKSNTPDKTLNTIDAIIDKTKDLIRKQELIDKYNARLEKVGHEYRYEVLIFDNTESEVK
jgi:hypothetical protein